jgi:hypothetical protein
MEARSARFIGFCTQAISVRASGGPSTPGPGSCIAPKPMRDTVTGPRG